MLRKALVLVAGCWVLGCVLGGEPAQAQYPSAAPPGYYGQPPCEAVTPGPLRGAGRGAAGGAVIGAITGNAGRGAAIGAAVGGTAGAIRRGSARAQGACY